MGYRFEEVAPGNRWREIRQSRNLTQDDVADMGIVTKSQLSKIENGGNVELKTIFRLLEALDCTFHDVYGR